MADDPIDLGTFLGGEILSITRAPDSFADAVPGLKNLGPITMTLQWVPNQRELYT